MTEKKSWEDIDIGGLSMESPENSHERSRSQRAERVTCRDIFAVVLEQSETVEVKIHNLTNGKESTGILLDISRGGVRLMTSEECCESNLLRLSFSVGQRKFLFRAKVAWSKKEEQGYLAGLQFIEPNATDVDYIRGLYLAVSLR